MHEGDPPQNGRDVACERDRRLVGHLSRGTKARRHIGDDVPQRDHILNFWRVIGGRDNDPRRVGFDVRARALETQRRAHRPVRNVIVPVVVVRVIVQRRARRHRFGIAETAQHNQTPLAIGEEIAEDHRRVHEGTVQAFAWRDLRRRRIVPAHR